MKTPAGRRTTRPGERSPSGRAAIPQDIFFPPPPDSRWTRVRGLISRRTRNLVVAAVVPIGAVLIVLAMLPSAAEPDAAASSPGRVSVPPDDSASDAAPVVPTGLRSYALPAPELRGLPHDALPGSKMEVWVAWEPPVTKGPRVQRLVDEAVLKLIAPPTVPNAPPTAVLLVADRAIPDLIYGDLYGRLAAVTLAD